MSNVATLPQQDLGSFWDDGYIQLPGFFGIEESKTIANWVEELAQLALSPECPKEFVNYFESKSGAKQVGRIENFALYHQGFGELFESERLVSVISHLMGEQAVLFKEKINYKLPGGGGFAAHQDSPAYMQFNQSYHITAAISVDAATVENGCLEFADGHHNEGILAHPTPDNLIIREDIEASLAFHPVETGQGDVLLFHSYAPHRSAYNKSDKSRRVVFATYGLSSEGDHRAAYYDLKLENPDDPALLVGLPFRADTEN